LLSGRLPAAGFNEFKRILYFLNLKHVFNLIDHSAILRRINNHYWVMDATDAKPTCTGLVRLKATVNALN